jgi:membrane-associated phospholipid phosphatase
MKLFLGMLGFSVVSWNMSAQSDTLNTSSVFDSEGAAEITCVEEKTETFEMGNAIDLKLSTHFLSGNSLSFDAPAHKKSPLVKFIIPTLCVAYGTVARFNDTPVRRFDKYVGEQVDEHIHKHYPYDNYLVYAPVVLNYGLDWIPGITAKHNFRDRTLILATSHLLTYGVVTTMKSQISVVRPRGWYDDSFPSGHTAVAFTGAHVLFKEYKDESAWIGVGGYAIATATSAFRVINRAHWVSDVVTGAGIGILSAEIGYMMLPVWHSLFGIHDDGRQMMITPSVNTQSVGVGMVYIF